MSATIQTPETVGFEIPGIETVGADAVRNSFLRDVVDNPLERAITHIAENHPYITPNRISIGAALSKKALNEAFVKFPEHGFIIGVAQTTAELLDLWDGKLARHLDIASLLGALLDSSLDKIGEIDHGLALSRRAFNDSDRVGGVLHALNGATAPLTAVARAYAESEGVAVKEGGLGTRTATATFNIVNTALLRERPRTAQALSAFMVTQKLHTAAQRFRAPNHPESKHHIGLIEDQETIADAKIRLALLGVIFIGGVAVTAHHLNRELGGSREPEEETQAKIQKPLLPKPIRRKLGPYVSRPIVE